MTLEVLQKRIAQLRQEQTQVRQTWIEAGASIHIYDGAIQDTQYWINELEKEVAAAQGPPGPQLVSLPAPKGESA